MIRTGSKLLKYRDAIDRGKSELSVCQCLVILCKFLCGIRSVGTKASVLRLRYSLNEFQLVMANWSPTLEGFRTVFRRPSLPLAEIAWRWSFGAAAVLLIVFGFFEYLDTLPVSGVDLFLLRSRQPFMVSQALARIFGGR